MSMFKRLFAVAPSALAAGLLTAAAFVVAPSSAHAQAGNNIQVLAMLEDADPRSVVRTSNIAKRVTAELKRSLQDQGFRMVDEEMIAADLGWTIAVRRPKLELIQAMNMANTSSNAALHVRAQAIFSIFAVREQLNFGSRIQVRVDGELYDAATRQFVGAFEMPRQTFSAPADCNDACLSEVVGDHAREIAISVGDVLGKQLLAIAPPPPPAPVAAGVAPGASGPVADGGRSDPRCQGMMTTYSLGFRRFTDLEVLQIMNVAAAGNGSGFPCFSSYETIGGTGSVQRFGYVSTASSAKLREWLTLLLLDMGLSTDRQVTFLVNGNEIMLDKTVPNTPRPAAPGAAAGRFQ